MFTNEEVIKALENSTSRSEIECTFCEENRFSTNHEIKYQGVESIIWSTNEYLVFPDIAPVLEGHLLIVPNNHCLCFGDMNKSLVKEIEFAKDMIRRIYKEVYNEETIFFEHGPAVKCHAGSCHEHAHMHCIPLKCDIVSYLQKYFQPKELSLSNVHNLFDNHNSYIYVEDNQRREFVFNVEILPSQFMRQHIAYLSGKKDWNWKDMISSKGNKKIFDLSILKIQEAYNHLSNL